MKAALVPVLIVVLCGCGDSSSFPRGGAARQGNPGPEDLRLEAMADSWKGLTRTERVEAIILLARSGDASARFALGNLYREGKGGVARDDKKAFELFHAAAEQGHAGAQFNLGAMYGNGVGVPRDDAEAMRWIREAAGNGHPMAKKMLERFPPA